jgi:hypothetical protein
MSLNESSTEATDVNGITTIFLIYRFSATYEKNIAIKIFIDGVSVFTNTINF